MGDITVTDAAHSSHLVEELVALRSAGELFDYVIKGTKESFHFHSLVLALLSPVFRAMLRSEMGESAKKEATFPSIPDNIIAKIIDYAYNGTCSFSQDHLMDLVEAAHYLQMSKLLKMCEEQISSVLQPANCIPWLQLADKLHLTTTMLKVQKMMQTSFKDIIMTTDFKQLEKQELLQYLIDMHECGTCSDDVLSGALQWIHHDVQNRQTHLEDLFCVVEISKCSDSFLAKMMDNYAELLDKQQNMYKLILSEVLRKSKDEGRAIIIMGGQSCSGVPNTVCWMMQNDETTKYSEPDNDTILQSGHSVCQIPGGFMVTGGSNSDLCVIFVLAMKMWVRQQSLLAIRSEHGSCFSNSKVFLIGGMDSTGFKTSSVDFMDMAKKTWHTGPPFPLKDALLKTVALLKSTVFVLNSMNSDFYKLDEDMMSWLTQAPLPTHSYGCSLAASGDKIFAAGGDGNINYMYTPTADVWCRLTGPSLQERQGALICYQQKLYLFPGCKRKKDQIDVEEYDISADRWSPTKLKMPVPIWKYSAFLVNVPE